MNTKKLAHIASELLLLAILSSCSAGTNLDSVNYQGSEIDQTSIIGGTDANLNYAKQNGIVGIYDQANGGICTGSLIAANVVLTAAHCVDVQFPDKTIIFFDLSLSEISKQVQAGNNSNIRLSTRVARHELYGSNKQDTNKSSNDIGLILFEGTAPEGFKLATVANSTLARALRTGAEVTLSGYGLNKFKKNPVTGRPVISEGSGILRMVSKIKILSVMPSLEEITLDQSKGKGACHGDSGGPAYLFDKKLKKNILIGLTSRGTGDCNQIAVYTSVIGYEKWIIENLKQLSN